MPHKCKKCLRELRPWSKFKDLKAAARGFAESEFEAES